MSETVHNRLVIGADENSYAVYVGSGLLAQAPQILAAEGIAGRPRVVTDTRVWRIYGRVLQDAFESAGVPLDVLEVEAGEEHKTLSGVTEIYDWLINQRAERGDPVLALGGGVVGDMVGFAAATYLRGVPLVHLPTTLLAQVDSSIGGKTGVDLPRGKNLVGAFYDPRLVLTDVSTLSTLPHRELTAGWAEVVKMAAILDRALFERLEAQVEALVAGDPAVLVEAIARSIELKGQVVTSDPGESGFRMVLNYGHTVGHAIEAATGYTRYVHGEAVSVGMAAAAAIARAMELLPEQHVERQRRLLERVGLPLHCDLAPEDLLPAMRLDKKNRQQKIQWILLRSIGEVEIRADVPESAVQAGLAAVCQ